MAERPRWLTRLNKNPGFHTYLFNHKALAKVFRARMLAGLAHAALPLPENSPTHWVVHCKSVGTGKPALVYLGRYLYRGVIREKDILACDGAQVRYRLRNASTGQFEQRTLPGPDFLWPVLQHVLPKGFRRARNFGFLHPNSRRLIALLHLVLKFEPVRATIDWIRARAPILCACCGAVMTIVRTRIRSSDSIRTMTPIPIAGTR